MVCGMCFRVQRPAGLAAHYELLMAVAAKELHLSATKTVMRALDAHDRACLLGLMDRARDEPITRAVIPSKACRPRSARLAADTAQNLPNDALLMATELGNVWPRATWTRLERHPGASVLVQSAGRCGRCSHS